MRDLESQAGCWFVRTGGTVVVATHGGDAKPHAQRLIQMNQGRLL